MLLRCATAASSPQAVSPMSSLPKKSWLRLGFCVIAIARSGPPYFVGAGFRPELPNKRLKLAGGVRLEVSRVLCAGAHQLSFNDTARGGRVARSLSAIR